jgi:mannitol/fructose-specific phosphotransferase system IIA component
VKWSAYSLNSIPLPHGTYYYTDEAKQGGVLVKEVTIQDGEINKFIISR